MGKEKNLFNKNELIMSEQNGLPPYI